MKKIHVFTSAAFNYIPKVRLLFESLRRLHPEFVLHLALADRLVQEIDLSGEPFDHVRAVEDMNIPNARQWIFCHRIVELATAIKPFMLKSLLDRDDCAAVLYMDPDTVAFSRLDDIVEALQTRSVVLTPHLTMPEESVEAVMDNEISCLKHGIYNLGFVGVKGDQQGKEFARWWADRIYRFCRDDIKNGLFTDQRWIDLVPAFFDNAGILRSPRLNVATWNLRRRHVDGSMAQGFRVNGEPLGFYHFTGFDSGAHKAMADKNAKGNPAVVELVQWYLDTTDRLGKDPLARVQWAYGSLSDGTPITAAQRVVYRDRPDLQEAFPDPFDARTFAVWWRQQAAREYPGLFSRGTESVELKRLTNSLSPGLSPERRSTHPTSATWPVEQLPDSTPVTSYVQPRSLLRRGWGVLRREGVRGVLRRLS